MPRFNQQLKIRRNDVSIRVAGDKRLASVTEAVAWPSGTQDELVFQTVWQGEPYSVRLGKPGKEAAADYANCRYRDGHRGNNPNDMRPSIFRGGELVEKHIASFVQIFDEIQKLSESGDDDALELIGALLFRSAFMIDHVEIEPGKWRYQPPVEVIAELKRILPLAEGLPIEVFLHFLDALAWNEDAKYHTLGYDIRTGTGRRNNLLTCVNLIGVLLNEVRISKFSGNFGRPPVGISAISNVEAYRIFPALAPDPIAKKVSRRRGQ
jgi:hypothetical protein